MRVERAPSAAKTGRFRSPIQAHLEAIHARYQGLDEGEVADVHPRAGQGDPDWFGIASRPSTAISTRSATASTPFTIQSISKPFVYGLALEDHGRERCFGGSASSPAATPFNAISLEPGTGRPAQPDDQRRRDRGSSLIAGDPPTSAFARMLADALGATPAATLDARRVGLRSERATGHRNRAHRPICCATSASLDDDRRGGARPVLPPVLGRASTCRDLGVDGGDARQRRRQPASRGERAIATSYVARRAQRHDDLRHVRLRRANGSYRVGLPAKSGVGGGIIAVLPGQFGIGVFSPRLDARGNSVRGVGVCRDLSRDFGLHFLRTTRLSRAVIRSAYGLTSIRSKTRRPEGDRKQLDAIGDRAAVYELQGDLAFCTVEAIVRRISEERDHVELMVLDMQRVKRIDTPAARMLRDLCLEARAGGKLVLFVGAERQPALLRGIEEALAERGEAARSLNFTDLDRALEWCEDRVLVRYGTSTSASMSATLASQEICRGLDEAGLAVLQPLLVRRRFTPGELVIRVGEAADAMYFLLEGRVSVLMSRDTGEPQRLNTLSPGMAFGELALVTRARRSADVRADTVVDCYMLSADRFAELGRTHPAVKMKLLENMLRQAVEVVARLNQEVVARHH